MRRARRLVNSGESVLLRCLVGAAAEGEAPVLADDKGAALDDVAPDEST